MSTRTILAAMLGLIVASVAHSQAMPEVVLWVNGAAITATDLEEAIAVNGPFLPVTHKQRLEALSFLVDSLLLRQFLTQTTPADANTEIAEKIEQQRSALMRGQNKTFEQFCAETHQTPEKWQAGAEEQFRWMRYVRENVDEAKVRKFYDENKDWFDRTTIRASQIVLVTPSEMSEAHKAEARAKLVQLRSQLIQGRADFATLAREHSQEIASKTQGGEIGHPITRKFYDEEFARAAFRLKIGEISEVVETATGLCLIVVREKNIGKSSEYEQVKEQAREMLALELRQQLLVKLRKAARFSEIQLPTRRAEK
jgi:parvulin-like peptidyl-prolyl isomerase